MCELKVGDTVELTHPPTWEKEFADFSKPLKIISVVMNGYWVGNDGHNIFFKGGNSRVRLVRNKVTKVGGELC